MEVFASFSTSVGNRLAIMKEIAKKWVVSTYQAETLYPHDEPIIKVAIILGCCEVCHMSIR